MGDGVFVPAMWTLREAAQRTGLSYDWLRKACLRGELVHIKCGTKFLLNAERLADYLNAGGSSDYDRL